MDKNAETGKISEIGRLLFEHFLAYQKEQQRDVRQKEFARHIGIDDKYYNHIYKGRQRPSKEVVRLLAEFFDDLRFYDVAGLPRPDPRLHLVQSSWKDLPNGITKQIADIVSEYRTRKKKE